MLLNKSLSSLICNRSLLSHCLYVFNISNKLSIFVSSKFYGLSSTFDKRIGRCLNHITYYFPNV